jgi:putative hydrolase of the HAD superfamily
MISALLIDLDDTLIDDRGAMADAVVLFRNEHKFCPDEDNRSISTRWDAVGRALWRRMSLGEVGFEEQRRMRLRTTFGLQLSDCEADSLFASYLAFYESSWRLMPGTEVFLSKTAHLPRAIVTNGQGTQARRKLERKRLAATS